MLLRQYLDAGNEDRFLGLGSLLLVIGLVLIASGVLGHTSLENHTGFSLVHFLCGVITGIGGGVLGVSTVLNIRGLLAFRARRRQASGSAATGGE